MLKKYIFACEMDGKWVFSHGENFFMAKNSFSIHFSTKYIFFSLGKKNCPSRWMGHKFTSRPYLTFVVGITAQSSQCRHQSYCTCATLHCQKSPECRYCLTWAQLKRLMLLKLLCIRAFKRGRMYIVLFYSLRHYWMSRILSWKVIKKDKHRLEFLMSWYIWILDIRA